MNRSPHEFIHRASLADRVIAFLILAAFLIYCAWYQAEAAPPMPPAGQPSKLAAGDVLDPEFNAPPEAAPVEEEWEWYIPEPIKAIGRFLWDKKLYIAAAAGTWYGIEKVDLHEDDSDPAPAPPKITPAAIAAAGDGVTNGQGRYTVTLTGYFVGGAQSVTCNGATKSFTPGLSFAQGAAGVKGGAIPAYISSRVCEGGGQSGGASWTPGTEGEIVILCPDPFYVGVATLSGGNSLILANGTRLAGGTIVIAPVEASQP